MNEKPKHRISLLHFHGSKLSCIRIPLQKHALLAIPTINLAIDHKITSRQLIA